MKNLTVVAVIFAALVGFSAAGIVLFSSVL